MSQENCVFCNKKEIDQGLLEETDNFYWRAAMRGALAPGHTLLISKGHFSCFGEMPTYLHKEYSDFLNKIETKIKEIFSAPILVEQGVHGQSVFHAHLHFLPSISAQYCFTEEKNFASYLDKEIPLTLIGGIPDIHNIFKKEGEYVFIKENGKSYICHTKDYKSILRPLRVILSKVTGSNKLLYWQTITDEEKKENQIWINETIQKLTQKI